MELSENYTRSSRSPAFLNYHPYLDGHWGIQLSLSHFCFFFEKPFTPYFSNSSKIHWFSKLDFHKYLLWCGFSSLTGLSRHLFISHQASCLMTTSPQSCHIMCHVATSILDSTKAMKASLQPCVLMYKISLSFPPAVTFMLPAKRYSAFRIS